MDRVSAALTLAIALAGCGDNSSDGSFVLEPCADRPAGMLCATLTVPVDYADSTAGTIALPVVVAPARDPSRRIGILTFNFGGPGGATLDPLIGGYPGEPIFTDGTDLTQVFDFVGMDWRGVATTSPAIDCVGGALTPRVAAQTYAPVEDAAWDELFTLVADVGAECTARADNASLLRRQDTESAARDFDALREALGEDQMNMWGVSYGSRLAAMYATLFPEHVRAVAIDSPVVPVPGFEVELEGQNLAFEEEIQRFFAWCAGEPTCPWKAAATAEGLAARYDAIIAQLNEQPITGSVEGEAPVGGDQVNVLALNLMYSPLFQWPTLAQALAAFEAGDATMLADYASGESIDYAGDGNGFSSYQNVFLQDAPLPAELATPEGYRAWAEKEDGLSPHVGLQNSVAQAFAVSWPAQTYAQHAIGGDARVLITATRHDPATPFAGAMQLQAVFPSAQMAIYEGEGHANAAKIPCVGELTAEYLVAPDAPLATTSCPAVPIVVSE